MLVGVDARQAYRPHRRGIGNTLINLYPTLAARRPGWNIVLFHQAAGRIARLTGWPNLLGRRIDSPGADRFDAWEHTLLPLAARVAGARVLHSPANTGPRYPLTPHVVTVHDLIPYESAPDADSAARWLARVRGVAHRAAAVTTGTEYSKQRIVEGLELPAGKVTVIPWAPDITTRRIDDPERIAPVLARYGLRPNEPYVFGFGADDPRKNTPRLIDAFARLPASLRAEVRLVLVGIQDSALPGLRDRAERLRIDDRVGLHGFATEADVPVLLSAATVVAFPSRNEGFGLPVLDAFACGSPVLAGNRTSIPEVAGDAAWLVDPDDTDALTHGLDRLLSDAVLRRELVAKGTARVAGFTWERTADAFAAVFEAVAGGGR